MHKRQVRFKIAISILLILFVLPLAFLLCERVRGQVSLARYKRALIATGEKLTAGELTRYRLAEKTAPLRLRRR